MLAENLQTSGVPARLGISRAKGDGACSGAAQAAPNPASGEHSHRLDSRLDVLQEKCVLLISGIAVANAAETLITRDSDFKSIAKVKKLNIMICQLY